jgi:hypothetical protein
MRSRQLNGNPLDRASVSLKHNHVSCAIVESCALAKEAVLYDQSR